MFKRVKYRVWSMIDSTDVEIWVEEDKLHYSKNKMRSLDWYASNKISPIPAEEFSKKMESIRIANWQKNYQPVGYIVMDGTSWSVEYEDMEGNKAKSSGDNAYPSNWGKFKKLLSSVVGELSDEE